MCIALITTAHPDYALVVLNNRDEFILRPTSRPHWWSTKHQEILSSRDLQREEQGTWMGITKTGNFAVLTNYREAESDINGLPIQGTRSRGGMVTAWLGSPEDETIHHFVKRMLGGEGVANVGGFSLLCGKLRKEKRSEDKIEPLAIISNRCGTSDDVPWVAERRGEVYGLSNTVYDDPKIWPKVRMGKEKLRDVINEAVKNKFAEDELVNNLYAILDTDTLPRQRKAFTQVRESIFIPSIEEPEPETPKPDAVAYARSETANENLNAEVRTAEVPTPQPGGVMSGIYGTQRQTIILVDWEGNVSFRERSLWDEGGVPIKRGEADVKFDFKIEGWEGERGRERNEGAILSLL